ncbi:hypothetical protein ACMD2_01258 [Ananas comosus]|uniref:Uncharacterized protein n=1 Tax=Ananas comosus TaxID=4615 RepID=A0A199V9Y2_ANACO|nr:hypothetical protein ACMD2_01258 [Ananas comosus]
MQPDGIEFYRWKQKTVCLDAKLIGNSLIMASFVDRNIKVFGARDGVELLVEYEDIIQKTFSSENEGNDFFNKYARQKGFIVRKDNVKRHPETGMVFHEASKTKEDYQEIMLYLENKLKKKEKRGLRPEVLTQLESKLEGGIEKNALSTKLLDPFSVKTKATPKKRPKPSNEIRRYKCRGDENSDFKGNSSMMVTYALATDYARIRKIVFEFQFVNLDFGIWALPRLFRNPKSK